MSSFAADWLALREPHDARARNPQVMAAAVDVLEKLPSANIVDLGCGTGAMLRALAPRIPVRQMWRLVDNDLGLLMRASVTHRPARVDVMTRPVDLARDLEAALDGPHDLITMSALLDLVSADWLERLTVEIAVRNIPIYMALSYDGRIAFEPADSADAEIVAAANAHQRGDKGFGPALGPAAADAAIKRFESLDYAVSQGAADWVLRPSDRDMQMQMLTGWASAARETGRLSLADTVAWLTRRREAVAAGRSSIRVGHIDAFARPIGTRNADRSQSSSRSSPS